MMMRLVGVTTPVLDMMTMMMTKMCFKGLRFRELGLSCIRMSEACFFTAGAGAPLKELNKARQILECSFNESQVS